MENQDRPIAGPDASSEVISTERIVDVQETSCCIVGGGPAGVMLSLLLARQGVPVTLLEMHKDFDREFRGDTVHPSTLEILDQIGLADPLLEMKHAKVTGPTLQFADGPFRPFDLTRLKSKYPYVLMIAQSQFLDFVARKAAQFPSFRLVMHAHVEKLVTEDGVVKGVHYRGEDGWHEVQAKLTVGADGRFSQLRQLAGIEPIKTAAPMDVLWFRLPKLEDEPDVVGGAFGGIGRGRIFILLDRSDYWQAGLVFPKGQYQELRAQGVEALRKSIIETEPRFAKHVETITDWHQLSLLSVESSRCPVWHKPGLLLIGDAAHVMSPVGGVGINYAIQDAVVAANILTEPLQTGNAQEAHLAEIQKQREWSVKVIQRMQRFMQENLVASVLRKQQTTKIPKVIRALLQLPIVGSLPPRLFAFGPRRVRIKPSLVESKPGVLV